MKRRIEGVLRNFISILVAVLLAGCTSASHPSRASKPTNASKSSTAQQPRHSLALKAIAYVGTDGGLWLYEVSSRRSTQLVKSSSNILISQPRFIGSNQIDYIETDDGHANAKIISVQLDLNKKRTVLKRNPDGIDAFGWTSKDRSLAYVREGNPPGIRLDEGGTSDRQIRTLVTSGGRDFVQEDEISIAWSPDGRSVLAVNTTQSDSIVVLDRSGHVLTRPIFGSDARWLPDGAHIIYRDNADFAAVRTNWLELDLRTNGTRLVARTADRVRARLSPDGKQLAYDDGLTKSFILDLSTGKERLLVRGAIAPVWTSSKTLLLTRVRPCKEGECDPTQPWVALGRSEAITTDGLPKTALSISSTVDADLFFG